MNIEAMSGIQLDIACGARKQGPMWIGMDIQPLPGVDIVHDIHVHPWPIPDGVCLRAIASHIVEHIPPCMITERGTRFPFIEFMDECWRVMKPQGELLISCPHAMSGGYFQDPTHCNQINEHTFHYFCPDTSELYNIYRPKPWKMKYLSWTPTGFIEAILIKQEIQNA